LDVETNRVGLREIMNSFAFIIHPIEPQKDVARKFPLLGKLPPGIINYFSRFFPPVYLSSVAGIRSEATHESIEGWLLACPMTPKRMLQVPVSVAYNKIVQTGRLAERSGARILGLGAYTSVVGDAGVTISKNLSIPVTTGNSYTAAVAIAGLLEAARRMDLELDNCTAAVVGAYGTVGQACAQLLARYVPHLILIGRQPTRLHDVKRKVESMGARATATTDLGSTGMADVVLTVTSSTKPLIKPGNLKPGAVVCDVARPRNVARQVVEQRKDVLVIEGGIVDVPGEVDFGFDFGLPPGTAYACMAETMILALEARYECYTLGRELSLDRVDEIAQLASKHGFRLSGFRSFDQAMSEEKIEQTRAYARLARSQSSQSHVSNSKPERMQDVGGR
jgi:fatty aldehyde-generating acyl-ACP reductase